MLVGWIGGHTTYGSDSQLCKILVQIAGEGELLALKRSKELLNRLIFKVDVKTVLQCKDESVVLSALHKVEKSVTQAQCKAEEALADNNRVVAMKAVECIQELTRQYKKMDDHLGDITTAREKRAEHIKNLKAEIAKSQRLLARLEAEQPEV